MLDFDSEVAKRGAQGGVTGIHIAYQWHSHGLLMAHTAWSPFELTDMTHSKYVSLELAVHVITCWLNLVEAFFQISAGGE